MDGSNTNPVVDRVTFNYGAALGRPKYSATTKAPWEDNQAAAAYDWYEAYTRSLASVSNVFSAAQWRMEMAIRDVRNATTEVEQAEAMDRARATFAEVDRGLDHVRSRHATWFRFGRGGDVLKRWARSL